MAGTLSRAHEAEQEHALVGDAGHLAEPSEDSGAHIGEAAGTSEGRETTDSGNLPTTFIANGYGLDSNLELVSGLNRITESEVNTAIKYAPRRGLRRAATIGCIGTHATQNTSGFSRSFSNGAEKTDKVKGRTKPRRKNANLPATEGARAGNDGASLLMTKRKDTVSENATSIGTSEMSDSSIESRDNETLANVHLYTPTELWTSADKTVTVDLPLVAQLVGYMRNPDQISASTVLAYFTRKKSWKLGTMQMIVQRFAAGDVPLLHKTLSLLELGREIYTILAEWANETPPLNPKQLRYPTYWPLNSPEAEVNCTAPSITRAWAARFLDVFADDANAIPQRTRQALRLYSSLPLSHLLDRTTPIQPTPPRSQPTRPKPPRSTTQAKMGGGNRTLPRGNMPSFTELTSTWYEQCRCTVSFKSVSGEVYLDATLSNLRSLLGAEPKTDLSGLRSIAINRRKQLDPEKVKGHFEAGGQCAEAAYYASVLTQLYGDVTKLRDARANGEPTGEIRPKRIGALGFPAGPSPQETRSAVIAWGKLHMGTWDRDDPASNALRSAMEAYVKSTVEPNWETRNLHIAQGNQPSARLSLTQPSVRSITTQSPDSAARARRAELAERSQACAIYSRGEIPPWIRDWSPLDDLTFIRNMATSEQATFTSMIPAPGLAVFMAASTDAELQKREQAEVQKHLNNGTTPPWCHASHGDNSNRDRFERFQTSLVTASSLLDVTEKHNLPRRDSLGARTSTNNRFAALETTEDDGEHMEQDDDQHDAEGDDQNEDANLYDPDDESYRIFLQQPSAGATVRTMQPIFPPAPELRPPTVVDDPASVVKALDRCTFGQFFAHLNSTNQK